MKPVKHFELAGGFELQLFPCWQSIQPFVILWIPHRGQGRILAAVQSREHSGGANRQKKRGKKGTTQHENPISLIERACRRLSAVRSQVYARQ
jgi:hypothetical protein